MPWTSVSLLAPLSLIVVVGALAVKFKLLKVKSSPRVATVVGLVTDAAVEEK